MVRRFGGASLARQSQPIHRHKQPGSPLNRTRTHYKAYRRAKLLMGSEAALDSLATLDRWQHWLDGPLSPALLAMADYHEAERLWAAFRSVG